MKSNPKSGKRLIITGISILALTWAVTLISSKLAPSGIFVGEGGYGDAILAVGGFFLAHLISIFFIFVGLIKFFLNEFSLQNKSSILLGTLGLLVLGGCAFYIYAVIYGNPFRKY